MASLRSGRAARGMERLRIRAWPVAQTAAAACLAWLFATEVLDHPRPFFAPVAAIIALRPLVATVDARAGAFVPDRFLEALTGGAIALIFSRSCFRSIRSGS